MAIGSSWSLGSTAEWHVLEWQVRSCSPGDRIGRETPLHCAVAERIVECGHDHRLIEYEVAVPDRTGDRVDPVEEAVDAVHIRVAGPQGSDVREGFLRCSVQREERGVRRHDILGG